MVATGVPNLSYRYDSTRKKSPRRERELNPGSSALEADALTTWPTKRSAEMKLGSGLVGAVLGCSTSKEFAKCISGTDLLRRL